MNKRTILLLIVFSLWNLSSFASPVLELPSKNYCHWSASQQELALSVEFFNHSQYVVLIREMSREELEEFSVDSQELLALHASFLKARDEQSIDQTELIAEQRESREEKPGWLARLIKPKLESGRKVAKFLFGGARGGIDMGKGFKLPFKAYYSSDEAHIIYESIDEANLSLHFDNDYYIKFALAVQKDLDLNLDHLIEADRFMFGAFSHRGGLESINAYVLHDSFFSCRLLITE